MRWQDQSERTALPGMDAFLQGLDALDGACVKPSDNTLPRVVIASDCLRAVMQHINASCAELGGLLVGQAYAESEGGDEPQLVAVNCSVESKTFDSTSVSLRMEAEVWELARPLLGSDARVIGWYHSHPDLGAFFSDTDRTTQRRFFRQPYSLGIVIDPVRDQLKAYLGPDCLEIPGENIIVPGSPQSALR